MEFQLDQLRALSAAVAEGSLEAAAGLLHVTPSAVSQRIKALEASVGRILLNRTKPIQATASGTTILRLARQVELLSGDAMRDLAAGAAPMMTIPIVVNADSLETWVLPALAKQSWKVAFDIRREDQAHSTALLRDGTVMAAITATASPVQGCSVARLGVMRYQAMASSNYMDRWFPDGISPAALAKAPVVVFDRKDDLQDQYLHSMGVSANQPPRHYVPASSGFAEAVVLGLGWGMLPVLQVAAHKESWSVSAIDPGSHTDVPLYWQQWRLDSAALTELARSIADTAAVRLR